MKKWLEKRKDCGRCSRSKWESVVETSNIVGQKMVVWGKQADERGKRGKEN